MRKDKERTEQEDVDVPLLLADLEPLFKESPDPSRAVKRAQQKEHAKLVSLTWAMAGLALFLTHGGIGRLVSVRTLLFFTLGPAAAALTIGAGFYVARRAVTRLLAVMPNVSPRRRLALHWSLLVAETVLTLLAAAGVYALIAP